MPAERGKPDSRGLNFFDITDFSPGIFDGSQIVNSTPPNNVPGIFPAPPGAADASATFGCIALPNGGLGAGPSLGGTPGQNGLSLTDLGIGALGANVDILAAINSFQSSSDELILGFTTVSGGTQVSHFYSYVVGSASIHAIQTASYTFSGHKIYCTYPFSTTVHDPAGASFYQPVVVLPLTSTDGPSSLLAIYPNPASPTAFGVKTVTAAQPGSSFGHQGRMVGIGELSYSHPVTVTDPPNELFSYTEPPLSVTWGAQAETFGPENPFGYGAFASVSAGELFAIKKRGGAVIIQGDLNNPTVTSLPSVKSTGDFYGRADVDPGGSIYYCSQQEGAWAWGGGNTSQKISRQLDDNFFSIANPITGTTNYGYFVQRWGSWMMFSNNWIFDTNTGGWWRLMDPAFRSFFWYVPGYDHRWMFASVGFIPFNNVPFLFEFDRETPGKSFTWQSLPIKIPSEDRTVTSREVTIRASNAYGDSAPVITVSLLDDKGNTSILPTWTMTPGTNTIQEFRLNAALRQTTTVAVKLACSGFSVAPVVHGLSLGYRPREHLGAV